MHTLEDITYDAGRHVLADQERLVAGIRQRTSALLAAQALVASFLGGETFRERPTALAWLALIALALGLIVAAILLAPWRLHFAVDAQDLYWGLREREMSEESADPLSWLAAAGLTHQALHTENTSRVRRMSWLSGVSAALMVVQTLAWLAGLVVY